MSLVLERMRKRVIEARERRRQLAEQEAIRERIEGRMKQWAIERKTNGQA